MLLLLSQSSSSRSTVVGILMMMEMSSTFLLSKLKPVLLDQLGVSGLFTLFSGVVFPSLSLADIVKVC